MKKIEYDILIDASPAAIWEVLWEDKTYREWTKVFAEGSRAETDWKEGSKILFTDGSGQGMVSEVAKNQPNEYMSIRHLGMLKDGKEIYKGDEIEEWSGALENYTLTEENGQVRLLVDIELHDKWVNYFDETWPKALKKVKEIAENQ